jgi:hypothetical protein
LRFGYELELQKRNCAGYVSKRDEEDIPRQEWINLLRKFRSEKLAELIK